VSLITASVSKSSYAGALSICRDGGAIFTEFSSSSMEIESLDDTEYVRVRERLAGNLRA
jgi:hypothetical protein